MLSNKFSFNFKFSILFIILILASLFFYINSKITNQFRSELNKQVQTVVNIYHDKVLSTEDNSDYLLEVLVPLIDELDIPMIITTQLSDGSYSHEHINIEITGLDAVYLNILEVSILSTNGKIIYSQKINKNKLTLNTSNFRKGSYFCKISYLNKVLKSSKFMIR